MTRKEQIQQAASGVADFQGMQYFILGAEWADKTMIEKACNWLNNFYSEERHCYLVKEDIEAFIKAMEE